MRRSGLARPQAGLVLISSLLLLLVVTILAAAMFRDYGVDEKIAGNSRDKEIALQAAESAEQYAEAWLVNHTGLGPSPVACSGPLTTPSVCANQLTDAVSLPWTSGYAYSPPTANGFTNSITLSAPPVFYIYLTPATGKSWTYVIDAVGYGASPTTVAVIESYFTVTPAPTCNIQVC